MLSFLFLLSGLGLLTSVALSSEKPFLHITVPEEIGASTHQGHVSEAQVTYILKIGNEFHTLLLEKQSFLSPYFMVYSYDKLGTRNMISSQKLDHCFYQGHSKEFPRSSVTLNICSGLRGVLQFEMVSYGIEPLESSGSNEHIIFQMKNHETGYSPLQEYQEMTQSISKSYKILVKSEKPSDVALQKSTLKIQIVMDKAMYDFMGSDADLATEKVVHIFALVNSIFSQLKTTILLTSLELWSEENKISTSGTAEEILQRFLSWKKANRLQSPSEMSYLLIYRDYADFVGTTYYGMACDPKLAVGVVLYPMVITSEAFSVAVVQLLGINLGLTYDVTSNCYCPGTVCLMNPEAIQSSGVKHFSSCSMEDFQQSISQPVLECLQNEKPPIVDYQGKSSTCGNGVLEGNEECDCGIPEVCTHKKCCNALDCKLIEFAECGSGKCCDKKTCKILKRGRLCRKSSDPCDFPEFCNGTSAYCVPDVKSADLEPCNNNSAYCFQGRCRDRDRQCAELFGEFSKGGNYLCVEEVNFQGDNFGNCKTKCNFNHVLCGKLICRWSKSSIVVKKNYDIQYMYLGGQVCISAKLRQDQTADDTYVEDGSICGDNRMCYQGSCSDIDIYPAKPSCNSKQLCNGHGVCNDRLNCHCDAGYSPPYCEATKHSPGGSIDDGFWNRPGKGFSLPEGYQRSGPKKGLLFSLYFYLPLFVIIGVIALKWNKLKKFWQREEPLSEGSLTEESSGNSSESWN
ncbi:A disintegrin and metallopeptidase domain 3-like isoform X1 [Ochotona princeps]|uniref:A disintegrin and metallopeptidase domain 3-like isoform X1 n=2 Tax=Ochotona princeps TaxID=9978 RepID=UPI00271490B8|nr:A disintegrin and metallopeptidase domain 3-like isoform X1 [Ochotona princeps]